MGVTLDDLRRRRHEIARIGEQFRVHNIRVFGSVVRRELEPWSDVDLLVDLMPNHSIFDRVGLVDALRQLLGTKVDVVSPDELRDYLRDQAHAEAVPL